MNFSPLRPPMRCNVFSFSFQRSINLPLLHTHTSNLCVNSSAWVQQDSEKKLQETAFKHLTILQRALISGRKQIFARQRQARGGRLFAPNLQPNPLHRRFTHIAHTRGEGKYAEAFWQTHRSYRLLICEGKYAAVAAAAAYAQTRSGVACLIMVGKPRGSNIGKKKPLRSPQGLKRDAKMHYITQPRTLMH